MANVANPLLQDWLDNYFFNEAIANLGDAGPPSHAERLTSAPAGWIVDQAAAGRIPHIRAGSRYLFAREELERALKRLARDRRTTAQRTQGGRRAPAR